MIENQIEKTDHRHLGQLLTYAAGLQSVTIVWVAAKFTEEHRAALDWLNEITDKKFRFFGLEVELWKIGNSAAAPKFNVISKPNNWSKTVSDAAKEIENQTTSETKKLQYRYWLELVDYLDEVKSKLRPQTPTPKHWLTFTIGRSGFHLNTLLNTRENKIGVELVISDKDEAKAFYQLLLKDKEVIEGEMGCALEWKENLQKTQSKVALFKNGDIADEKSRPVQQEWIKNTLEKFDSVFRQRIRNI